MLTFFSLTTKKRSIHQSVTALVFAFIGLVVLLTPVAASASRIRVADANRCMRYFDLYERKFSIPTHLLQAIAINESGRWHDVEKKRLPWPWTINVEGKGYYFNSKNDAIQNIKIHVMNGAKSFDVGCMQVNMYYHGEAFRNLQQAFDPRYNVAYAASLLRTNYNKFGNWDKAVAAYHSQTGNRGKEYAARVRKIWHGLMQVAYFEPRPANVQSLALNTAKPTGADVE